MNCEANKNLDRYISRALFEGCGEVAKEYDAIDVRDVQLSLRTDRRIHRIIRRRENRDAWNKRGRFVKRALVGAFLISFIFLTAILSIAAARGELVSSLVSWYDDHISIHFGEIEEKPGDGMLSTAPTYLKEMYEPSIYGYKRKCERLDNANYETFVLGYYDDVQVQVCKYQQSVWRLPLAPQDKELYDITPVDVGKYRGEVYDEKNGGNLILIWDDGRYHYKLESDTFLDDDLIAWAQTLTVAYNVMPSPVVDVRRPVIDSPVITSQVIKQQADYISTDYYRSGDFVCRFIQTTEHKSDGGVLAGYYLEPNRIADVVIGHHVGLAYIYTGMIEVIWEDEEYQYRMQSPCMTLKEMIRWCETTRSVSERFTGIRQILSPRGLPSNIEERVYEKGRRRVEIDYYRDGECICAYTQMILSDGVPSKGNGYVEQSILIHHAKGVFRQYDNGKLVMIWNDDNYRYRLESEHLSREELLSWALSIAPPAKLEEIRKPEINDSDITEQSMERTETVAQYAYRKNGKEIAQFRQLVMYARTNDYDNGCTAKDIYVGDYHGVALLYDSGKIMLVWTDKTYSYELESSVLTLEELIAMGTCVEPIEKTQEQPEHPEEIVLPDVLQEVFLPDYTSIGCKAKEVERTDVSVTTEFYLDNRLVATLTQSIMRGDMMEYTPDRAYAKRGIYNGFFRYTIYDWYGKGVTRVWTDGQYRYRLEMNQKDTHLWHIFSNVAHR